MARRRYRYDLGGSFERIPGPERKYREISTGRVVSRTYVYSHSERVRLSGQELRASQNRARRVHDNRVMWYKNHYNYRVWREGGPPSAYIGKRDVEMIEEFQNMEWLIHAPDADVRDIGYEFFAELEDEYVNVDWGETP